jgi:hypothetical protein
VIDSPKNLFHSKEKGPTAEHADGHFSICDTLPTLMNVPERYSVLRDKCEELLVKRATVISLRRPSCDRQVFASVEVAENFVNFMNVHGSDFVVESMPCDTCQKIHVQQIIAQ